MPRGGVSFEEFLESGGTDNYTFNVVDLTKKTFEDRVKSLIEQTNKTIEKLDSIPGKKIEEFCVGKTFVRKLKKGPKFNPTDANTWKVAEGPGARWRTKYLPQEYNGLVVLGAVSSDMLKDKASTDGKKCNTYDWNHQSYALALESALISHYAFQAFDDRLANRSLSPGNLQSKLSAGYVIYFAFKYEETEEETGEEESTEKEEGTEQEEDTEQEEGTEYEESKKSKQEGGYKKEN